MTELAKLDLDNPDYYENREVSWLNFNHRVLQEAADDRNPLLERLSFLSIGTSNLDEFMMVRVAGLQDQYHLNINELDTKKQWTPEQQLIAVSEKNHENNEYQYTLYQDLKKEVENYDIHFISYNEAPEEHKEAMKKFFFNEIYPTLTPLGIDAYRPFPSLNNKLIHIFVNLSREGEQQVAIVPIPQLVNRFYHYEKDGHNYFIYLEDIVTNFIETLFTGYHIDSTFLFRVTRNADLDIQEDGAEDLLTVIEDYLVQRRNGMAVRIEVQLENNQNQEIIEGDIEYLLDELGLFERDLYFVNGPLDLTGLNDAIDVLENYFPQLRYKPFKPVYPAELQTTDLFKLAEKRDIFLHHPYDSFKPVVEFIQDAANDPNTLAIKQTLYRVSSNSPIISALKTAAERGKQVTVLVELKARFDEENNVQWAKVLEEAGCHVIYGKTHLKTHSKIAMVVKQKNGRVYRYVHLGTGNYNDKTARFYSDMGIITTNEGIAEDATDFFNYLSGYSNQPDYHYLHVSPFDIRDNYIEDIEEEIQSHKVNGNGHIIAKMNSLTSKDVIKKMYEASQAGVKVDLIIRGICCLVPGIPGVSENINVISVVGRFLEHSRIYWFKNNGDEKLFLSSADMMTRNMIRRVEIEFPVLDKNIHNEIMEILRVYLDDNTKARYKLPDCSYQYVTNDLPPVDSQQVFMKKAQQELEKSRNNVPKSKMTWFERLQHRLNKK
ncbi:RNA degradosome polyphosphate kinase [Aerococcus agrisoli]|uniref:Polyphosphate kinase n=1 Tax=Aerococcus agrisoli TaxID=2487350 RepID=A0A3N4G6C6_9LACT|nr:RNA degradosome polyphosphate kinase [Aerococcus agrisoli]RPA56947.1 RNA degradosome polyphosphate kinase [Aerococcus agrisoli]